MNAHEEQAQRAAAWYGLRPSGAYRCPRVVAGKRCLTASPSRRRYGGGELCICERRYRLLDHPRIWLDQTGRHVFTAEPYNAAGEEVAALLRELDDLGLAVTFDGRFPWNPGNTFVILVHQRDQEPSA